MLSADLEEEENLRKECIALLFRQYKYMLNKKERSKVAPRGGGVVKLTGEPLAPAANEESGRAMGRESSVDVELARVVESVEIGEERVPDGLVPPSLPMELREDLSSVEESTIAQLYDPARAMGLVNEGRLTQQEVLALYLRAFGNIMAYEVDQPELLRNRFLVFFSSVFINLVELCYPNRGTTSVEDLIRQDFQAYQKAQRTGRS